MVFTSKLPVVENPKVSIFELVFEHKRDFPKDDPCFINTDDESEFITFGQVKTLALRFGAGLKRMFPTFSPGDVVAMISPSEIHYVPIAHGIVTVGGVVASVDHTADVDTITSCLTIVDAKYIIAHPETIDKAIRASEKIGLPKSNVFVLDNENMGDIACVKNAFWGEHTELAVPVKYTEEELKNTVCYYYFTSGTSGNRKAVTITQRSLVNTLTMKKERLPPGSRTLSHTALHHASSLIITFHLGLMSGCPTYLLKQYSLERLLKALQDFKIMMFASQPWIVSSLVKSSLSEKYDISSVKFIFCGGAITGKQLILSFYKRFGIPVINSYGMTEVMGSHTCSFEHSLAGNIGILTGGFTSKVIGEDGQELGYNQRGEMLIKGPAVSPGYRGGPQINAHVFDSDGYFHTGDMVEVNEKGEFYYVDRIKDIIKYKAHEINPQEIESVLMSQPSVIDCAVVGAYNEDEETWLPRAFVMASKTDLDAENLKSKILDSMKENLADEKQLRGGLYVVEELPRNSTGKINRRALIDYNLTECY